MKADTSGTAKAMVGHFTQATPTHDCHATPPRPIEKHVSENHDDTWQLGPKFEVSDIQMLREAQTPEIPYLLLRIH